MTRAVFLDALGTLVELEPPWVGLRERVPDEISDERLVAAVKAEMAYYREHAHEGRDPDSLADLRERCAELISRELRHPDQRPGAGRLGPVLPLPRRRAGAAGAAAAGR